MLEIVFAFFMGMGLGIISGIVPGVNVFVSVLLVFPILLSWEPTSIMFMYITLASVHQYFGSVSATVFAIPGTSTSLPALHEGHAMFQDGRGGQAIMTSAIGSFFASFFAIVLIQIMLPYLTVFYQIFNTHVQVVLLTIAAMTIVIFSSNKFWISLLLWITGNVLAMVGIHEYYGGITFMTFGITELYTGIDLLPVLIALYVFPVFLRASKFGGRIHFEGVSMDGYLKAVKNMYTQMKMTLLRSSMIGAVLGFVPGISWGLSTLIAYNTELGIRKRNKLYNKNGDVNCLVAAESSNNASVYTSMVPMLFAGIPITASTALIYDVFVYKNINPTLSFFESLYGITLIGFGISSLVGLFIAGKYVNFLKFLSGVDIRKFYIVLFSLLVIICYTVAQKYYAGVENLIMLACLMPFGYLLRNYNTMPLVYGFVLQDIFIESVYRLYFFY